MRTRTAPALAVVAALATSLLAACGSSTGASSSSGTSSAPSTTAGSSSAAPADFGAVTEQLSWYKNIEFSGEFAAIDKGFFTDAGFSKVDLVAGGPTVAPAEVALASGDAWIGRTSPLLTAAANAAGGDNVIVAALYQKNPYTLTYLASKPLTKPEDLIGKTVAVPDAALAPWNIFLAANHIDPSKVTRVPSTGIDSEEQLAGGAFAALTYGAGANLTAAGKTGYQDYVLNDHGVTIVGEALVVSKKTLQTERDKVKAFLVAWIKGWNAVIDDEKNAVSLAVDKYGKDGGLDAASQTVAWQLQRDKIVTDDVKAHGIGTITPALVKANVDSINLAGYSFKPADLFDTSLIDEVYAEHPELAFPGK